MPQNLFFLKKKKSQKVNSTPRGDIKENVSFIWSCLGLAAFKLFQGIFFLSCFLLPKCLLCVGPRLPSCHFYGVTECSARE